MLPTIEYYGKNHMGIKEMDTFFRTSFFLEEYHENVEKKHSQINWDINRLIFSEELLKGVIHPGDPLAKVGVP